MPSLVCFREGVFVTSSSEAKANMPRLGFIGAGTVGTSLAIRLKSAGYHISAVASRSHTSAEKLARMVEGCHAFNTSQDATDNAEIIFITTPDDAIPAVASEIEWHPGQSVVHCSGADSTEILTPAKKQGANIGVFHPLQTFSGLEQALENIPGSTFALEAEEPLLSTLKEMAAALNGYPVILKAEDKVLYHTAAVITCNYLVTLTKLATDLWQTFNVPTREATRALLPLLRGTISNLETIGTPNCLTGPISRGDTGTVKKHLNALKEKAPDLLPAYRELGLQTIPIALAKGKIGKQQAHELETALAEYP